MLPITSLTLSVSTAFQSYFKNLRLTKKPKTTFLVHLINDPYANPQSIYMGLHLPEHVLDRTNDIEVIVFVNIKAVKLFQAGADELIVHDHHLPSLLHHLFNAGARILVCKHCLSDEGIPENIVPKGFELGQPEKFIEILRKNPVVFTF